jgi:hypothetical protein
MLYLSTCFRSLHIFSPPCFTSFHDLTLRMFHNPSCFNSLHVSYTSILYLSARF